MNQHSAVVPGPRATWGNIISTVFGVLFLAIGLVNTFWGNDPQFGVFIILLSFLYFPPVSRMIKNRIGFPVSPLLKIIIGVFIIWAAMGVGELFDKIDIMLADFK
ncbi:MAG: hypothetical protein ACXWV2_06410 [Chitinophagaceae bacterium]